jgi:hypothetical protein
VFQSCLSAPENDVVVQFLSDLDMDEDSETTSMETPSSEKTNDIEFQERNITTPTISQSEIHKDNEKDDTHDVAVIFEDVRDYKNVFVSIYGRVDTPISFIPSKNISKIKKMKQE